MMTKEFIVGNVGAPSGEAFIHLAGGKKGGKGDGAIGGWNFGGKYEMGLVKELEFSAWPIIKPVTS